MFNSTRPQQHRTPLDFTLDGQLLQHKHPDPKPFSRTPSGKINPLTLPSKSRGTSIGKHWEERACDSARGGNSTNSEYFY